MRILAADIGGTNSRFALFATNPLRMEDTATLSSNVPDFPTLLDMLAGQYPALAPEKADCLSLALAGLINKVTPPSLPTRAQLSNQPWCIDLQKAREGRHFGPALLLNDFEAQAWACTVPSLLDAIRPVFAGEQTSQAQSLRALIGAGTGLGHAMLMPMPDGSEAVFPSEGAYAPFAFTGAEEHAFGDFVRQRKKLLYVRNDDVVCGPGLALLYEYHTGKARPTAGFTADPDFPTSPVCRIFSRFYGRAARNLALFCLPMRGLIITGGLAAHRPFLVHNDDFRHEFLNVPQPHSNMLARIPISLNTNQASGLWGAAKAAERYFSL